MKRFAFILLALISTHAFCQKHRAVKGVPAAVSKQAEILDGYYSRIQASSGPARAHAERLFFDAFPGSFVDFNKLYGAVEAGDAPVFGPLYECPDHIAQFHQLRSIDRKELYGKQIRIALGGQWDADNVSAFQRDLQASTLHDSKTFADLLKARPESEVRSFCAFLLDNPNPQSMECHAYYEKLYGKLKPVSPALASIIKEQYDKLHADADTDMDGVGE